MLRLAVVILLLATPLATALETPTAPTLDLPPEVVALLSSATSPAGALLQVGGDPTHPQSILLKDASGATLLRYAQTPDGRATVEAGGETVVPDATFVRLDGDPTRERFTLVLREPQGQEVKLDVDRVAFLSDKTLAEEPLHDVVTLLRGIDALGGPGESHLLRLMDTAGNVLAPADLDGTRWLARGAGHAAFIQAPEAAESYDRIVANISVGGHVSHVAFAKPAANLWRADFAPGAQQDGAVVALGIFYERRHAPMFVERFVDPHVYRYRLDGTPPTVLLDAPTHAQDFRFTVAWSGADGQSGVAGFDVQSRRAGDLAWQPWITKGTARSATFSGAWATTHEFRARSIDAVGNPSTWATMATIVKNPPINSDETNDPPSVRLLTPKPGDRLSGIVRVSWDAKDADGVPPIVTVQVSEDDGATWRTLYSGTDSSIDWDTGVHPDGATYRLRLTASDGTLTAADALGSIVVDNLDESAPLPSGKGGGTGSGGGSGGARTPPASPPRTQPTPTMDPGADLEPVAMGGDGGRAIPAMGLLLAGLGASFAALCLRRRRP